MNSSVSYLNGFFCLFLVCLYGKCSRQTLMLKVFGVKSLRTRAGT